MQPVPRDSANGASPRRSPGSRRSFELPGMYQKLGGYFGQNGGVRSRPLGAGMAAYSAAYQDAFQKGQDWKMRMAAGANEAPPRAVG